MDHISHPDDVRVMPPTNFKCNMRRDQGSLSVPKTALALSCVAERVRQWTKERVPDNTSKYRSARYVEPRSAATSRDIEPTLEDVLEPYSDVLMTIRVMRPMKYDPYTRLEMSMDREIIVLGQQYLHEFRDMITCVCDSIGPMVDISKDPGVDVRSEDPFVEHSNSGFLFIGDTFYNDHRIEANSDNANVVVDWAKRFPEIGELKTDVMEKTQFIDLKGIRIGFPYLYQHFGECEHVFIFSDIRVLSPSDNLLRSDYPYLHLLNNFRGVVCDICGKMEAIYSVSGSTQHIFDPVRLCARCMKSYHYVDGKKVGEFSAYQYRK